VLERATSWDPAIAEIQKKPLCQTGTAGRPALCRKIGHAELSDYGWPSPQAPEAFDFLGAALVRNQFFRLVQNGT
jgi:hypothetical protein